MINHIGQICLIISLNIQYKTLIMRRDNEMEILYTNKGNNIESDLEYLFLIKYSYIDIESGFLYR